MIICFIIKAGHIPGGRNFWHDHLHTQSLVVG